MKLTANPYSGVIGVVRPVLDLNPTGEPHVFHVELTRFNADLDDHSVVPIFPVVVAGVFRYHIRLRPDGYRTPRTMSEPSLAVHLRERRRRQ